MVYSFRLPLPILPHNHSPVVVLDADDVGNLDSFKAKCDGTHFISVLRGVIEKCDGRFAIYNSHRSLGGSSDARNTISQDVCDIGHAIALCYLLHRIGDVQLRPPGDLPDMNIASQLMSDGLSSLKVKVGSRQALELFRMIINEAEDGVRTHFGRRARY